MIIAKFGDVTLEKLDYLNAVSPYAVFIRVKTPSGTTAYFQQKSKWYAYEKCARKQFDKICENLIKEKD